MAFKYIIFICFLVAVANARLFTQANTYTIATPIASLQQHEIQTASDVFASTQQHLARSLDGTITRYHIDTPYSNIHNQDTRISNKVYTPSLIKSVNFASPALGKTIYAAPMPTAATFYTQKALPVQYIQPTQAVPSTIYSQALPEVVKAVTYAAAPASASFNHIPSVTTYSQGAPIVSGYGSIQSVLYSPAEKVSHVSFNGFGTHWGY